MYVHSSHDLESLSMPFFIQGVLDVKKGLYLVCDDSRNFPASIFEDVCSLGYFLAIMSKEFIKAFA